MTLDHDAVPQPPAYPDCTCPAPMQDPRCVRHGPLARYKRLDPDAVRALTDHAQIKGKRDALRAEVQRLRDTRPPLGQPAARAWDRVILQLQEERDEALTKVQHLNKVIEDLHDGYNRRFNAAVARHADEVKRLRREIKKICTATTRPTENGPTT